MSRSHLVPADLAPSGWEAGVRHIAGRGGEGLGNRETEQRLRLDSLVSAGGGDGVVSSEVAQSSGAFTNPREVSCPIAGI